MATAQLPDPGMKIDPENTALVITDPQNDFLSREGVAWGVVGESVTENKTVENIETLFKAAKSEGIQVFISPHDYYPPGSRLEVRRSARKTHAQYRDVRSQGLPEPGRLRGLWC